MSNLKPGTKQLTTRAAVDDYVAGFNSDDFPRFIAYYAEDAVVSATAISICVLHTLTVITFVLAEHPRLAR